MASKSRQSKKSDYRSQLELEVKPMVQKANAMLLNLEKLAKTEEFAGIEQFAYRNAMQAIKEIRGPGYKRFNMPKNTHQLEKVQREIEKFINQPTASKQGIEALYEKNAAWFNKEMGSKFSWQKMGSFLHAAEFEELKSDYFSTTAVLIVGQFYKHRRTGKKKFIQMLEKHEIEGLDEVDQDTLAEFVRTKIKWTDLR
jgi:hypothetical protein